VKGRIVAVVPVRSLRNGKTRLAPVLAPEAREKLLRHAAERVIRAAVESGTIDTILVVSPEHEALAWAADLDDSVSTMSQRHDQPGLNGAVDAGRDWARTVGATAIVSLFADLPLVRPGDIRGLTARLEPVVLGPDRRGEGTNALLLRLAGRGPEFRFAFGKRSLVKHLQEARRLGLDVAVHDSPGIGFDLDTPDDWSDFLGATAEPELSVSRDAAECGAGVG
jgi:2-phospho-L-lactate/phosphoenolpyruvate guanylyltransferase